MENTANSSARKWWILSVAASGVLLATIDGSIVNIALPTMSEYFKTSVQNTALVTMSYLIVITSTLLLFGKLSDFYGQKLIFITGLFAFTISSLLCALAVNINQLIFFRVLQGLGAAMIVSNTPAIVTNAFPPNQRGAGLGIIGTVVSVGLMTGPVLGGIIINYWGWQYIFIVNLPVGLIGIILAFRVLPEMKSANGPRPFYLIDSLLWVGMMISLIFMFTSIGKEGASNLIPAFLLASFVMLVSFFAFRQNRSDAPLFDPVLFKNQIFLFSSIAGFFAYMGMIGISFMLPFFLERSLDLTPMQSGRILVAIPASTALMAPLSGFLSDKFGQRHIATIGMAIALTAIAVMYMFHTEMAHIQIVANLVLFGMGIGMFSSPNNSALMGSVDSNNRGSAAGVLATVRNLGMVSGVGVISVLFNNGLKSETGDYHLVYMSAFKGALPLILAFITMAMIFSASRKSVISKNYAANEAK